MMHPRLCVNALSSFSWSFEQDLALWKELGIGFAGLLIAKIEDDVSGKLHRLVGAGIRPSVIVCGGFNIGDRGSWQASRDALYGMMETVSAIDRDCVVYFPPGRTTGDSWEAVFEQFSEAVAPCVAFSRECGVKLAFEPTQRTDASFVSNLRDAVHVARNTGLGIVFDFGNCWMERDLRATLLDAREHIALVQIDDVHIGGLGKGPGMGRVQIGEGELQLQRLMQYVLDAGYSGVFDLEVIGQAPEQEGYETALRRGVPAASRLLTEMGL